MRPYLTDIRKIFILTNFILLPYLAFAQTSSANASANFESGICEIQITEMLNTSASINISSDNGAIILKNVQVDQKPIIQSSQLENLGNISLPAFFVSTINKSEIDLQFNSAATGANSELLILLMPQGSSAPVLHLQYQNGSVDSFQISFSEQTVVRINP